MKFDMGQAWSDAMALIGANRDVMLIVAGVFFFLPYLALMLLLPESFAALEATQQDADPDQMMAALNAFYAETWWAFLLIGVAQGIGTLGLLALLTDRARPTVGEALKTGAIGFLPYLAVQILQALLVTLIVLVPIAVGAGLGSPALGVLLGVVAALGVVYLVVKFSLSAAVIAIEKVMNPIRAMRRSWALTRGNSLRLFAFYMLLLICLVVIAAVVGMVVGIVFALMGDEAALIGDALFSALLNAAFVVLLVAVLAAVHRQLAGSSAEAITETFA